MATPNKPAGTVYVICLNDVPQAAVLMGTEAELQKDLLKAEHRTKKKFTGLNTETYDEAYQWEIRPVPFFA